MMFANRYESPTPPPKNVPHQPPRLSFFISRNNGNIVPLIPADELPYSVRLSGVQRSMRMENTCGMQHVGNLPFTGQYFRLEAETLQHTINTNASNHKSNGSIAAKQILAPDDMIRRNTEDSSSLPTASLPAADQAALRQLPVSTTATTWRRQGEVISAASTTAQATIDAILASEPRPVRGIRTSPEGPQTPSSSSRNGGHNTPDSGDKVYCTHWIRHGECDYIQQGCRYKHEMPNKATLQSIGFRTVPRWWQEKVAVQLGQSAIPIVGAGLRPSEWMKLKKRTSDSGESSNGDSDSESDLECGGSETESEVEVEEGSEHEEKLDISSNAVKIVQSEAATKHMMDQPAKTATPLSSKSTTPEALPTTKLPQAVLNTSAESIRKPSLIGSDLIDFSPAESTRETFATFRSSCPSSSSSTTTAINELEHQEAKSKPTAPAPAPAINSQDGTKQYSTLSSTSPQPRKIFVPAGESKEYHIAHARSRNAAVPSTEVPPVKFTLGGGHPKEVPGTKQTKQQHSQQAKTFLSAKKCPNPANSPSGKGLLASVHAPSKRNVTSNPTPTPTPTPTATALPSSSTTANRKILSPTTMKQQQHRKHLLQQAKKSRSGHHGSRCASSHHASYSSASPAPAPGNDSNPMTPETGIKTSDKGPEGSSKKDKPVVIDACRPRRPAGTAGKESRQRSKQASSKDVRAEK